MSITGNPGKRQKVSLLIDEPPLMVVPTLARLIGLSEAILLQQIHWWITQGYPDERMPICEVDGLRFRRIPPNVMDERLPFWEHRNIQRLVSTLKNMGLLLTRNLNTPRSDSTAWYAVDYGRLVEIAESGTKARTRPGRKSGTQSLPLGDAMIALPGRNHCVPGAQSLPGGGAMIAPPYKVREETRQQQNKKQQQERARETFADSVNGAAPTASDVVVAFSETFSEMPPSLTETGGIPQTPPPFPTDSTFGVLQIPNESSLRERMLAVGVSPGAIPGLLAEGTPEEIALQLDCLPDRHPEDPAKMLVKAIREDWAPPATYVQRLQAEADARQAAARAAALKLEQDAENARQAQAAATAAQRAVELDAIYGGMPPVQQQRVDELVRARLETSDFYRARLASGKLNQDSTDWINVRRTIMETMLAAAAQA